MMPLRPTHPRLLAVAAAIVAFSGPTAHAADLIVGPDYHGIIYGEQTFDLVEIGSATGADPAILPVPQYETSDATLGWLHLRAHTIIIHPNGVIDATGKGFRGSQTAGAGPGAGSTPPVPSPPAAAPGGGGAREGYGGTGATLGTPDCLAFVGAEGGQVYEWDPLSPQATGLGSSGGSGHSLINPGTSRNGGPGGGLVILEAVSLTLNGTILVDGADAPVYNGAGTQGVAAGGGAGGTVVLKAQDFVFDEASADPLISATGGIGATDAIAATVVGGGGGGGLVLAELPLPSASVPVFQSLVDVSGGVRTDLSCANVHPGGPGALQVLPAPACPDIDGDGYEALECGGDDCDDGKPEIHPNLEEDCNGVDDNCVGGADEEPDGGVTAGDPRCGTGTGQICVEGTCIQPDAGVAPTPPSPPETRLGGGLCAATMASQQSAAALAALLGLLGVGALSRRRRNGSAAGTHEGRDRH